MDVKVCPNCGTENPFEANFCRGCRYEFVKQNVTTSPVVTPVVTPAPPKTEGLLPKIIVIVVFAIVILAASVGIYFLVKAAMRHDEEQVEHVQSYTPETFAGDYAMKLVSGDIVSRYTAVVKDFASNKYRVEVITEYGKSMYTFTAEPDGTVDSPELGKGQVSYKASINKLTIEFSGRNSKCELSRIQ